MRSSKIRLRKLKLRLRDKRFANHKAPSTAIWQQPLQSVLAHRGCIATDLIFLFPCVLKVCISLNCIMPNQLIFSAHTADISMRKTECVFHNRIISRNLWSARSPDITPCDFYLWGRLKNAVYKTNPRILEELKCNIRDEINIISRGELQHVMGDFIKRCQKCMHNEGG